ESGDRYPTVSGGLADRAHVEVGDPERGHDAGLEVVSEFPRQRRLRRADVRGAGQQRDGAFVETEVVHRTDDLALLDEEDAVPGQTGEQQRLRVDRTDVPQAGQQQAAVDVADHLLERRIRPA